MRPSSNFPEGFGFDPTMMLGASPRMASCIVSSRPADDVAPFGPPNGALSAGHVPGPFAPAAFPWEAADITPGARHAALLADGSHFDPRGEAEDASDARRIEPQSVIVTTALVGILLATMGYFLDFR